MPDIDPALLPERALVDTSIVFGAFGSRATGAELDACRDFFQAMIENGKTILIAAPSVTELLRGSVPVEPPRRKGIVVVALDDEAARILATGFPANVLKKHRDESGAPLSYIKYDALIVACAKRHRATHLVTRDMAMARLAEAGGLKARLPSDFYSKQGTLPLRTVAASGHKPKVVR